MLKEEYTRLADPFRRFSQTQPALEDNCIPTTNESSWFYIESSQTKYALHLRDLHANVLW